MASRSPQRKRQSLSSSEPGERALKRLRLHLTIWYSSIFGSAFLLFCLALYFGVQQLLLAPIPDHLGLQSSGIAKIWGFNPNNICQISSENTLVKIREEISYIACTDPQGKISKTEVIGHDSIPAGFFQGTITREVAQDKIPKSDIVDSESGRIYRYARPLYSPDGKRFWGVIMVGHMLNDLDTTLQTLLAVMIFLCLMIMLVGILGGSFLANRALGPARLAFIRQQRFIADASHEIRTPLTFLQADAELLLNERDQLSQSQVALLEEMSTEATHLSTLAQNMLTLARLDANKAQNHLEQEVINLHELSNKMRQRAFALAKQKEINVESKGEPIYLLADRLLLEQAILTLVENAIQYTPTGGTVLLEVYQNKQTAYLTIKDNGIGIAAEHLPHLGERFFRVDKARSRSNGGTGLGLAIAHRIIRLHQGSLQLKSELGKGTTAIIALPLSAPPANNRRKDLSD